MTFEDVPDEVRSIGTFSKHSAIFFAHGAELADPDALLEGSGKLLRYITLETPADGKRASEKRLVKAAFARPRAPR